MKPITAESKPTSTLPTQYRKFMVALPPAHQVIRAQCSHSADPQVTRRVEQHRRPGAEPLSAINGTAATMD